MADFFRLTAGEDKVISREQRIFSDATMATSGVENSVTTTSTAPKQKMKFFLDVVAFVDSTGKEHFVKAGKYYELDHKEVARAITSQGIVDFFYTCTDRAGNGTYNWTLTFVQSVTAPKSNVRFYVSEIVFEDSYYDWSKGWLEESNPDNIIDLIDPDDDKLPGGEGEEGGKIVLSETVNGGIVMPHHWGFLNWHVLASNIGNYEYDTLYNIFRGNTDSVSHGFWTVAYMKNSSGSQEFYVYHTPVDGSLINNQSDYNISSLFSESNSTAVVGTEIKGAKPRLVNSMGNYPVAGALISARNLGEPGIYKEYFDFIFTVRDTYNPHHIEFPEQAQRVTSSVRVTGWCIEQRSPDETDSMVGIKMSLFHNGANISSNESIPGEGWPDWAEDGDSTVGYKYSLLLGIARNPNSPNINYIYTPVFFGTVWNGQNLEWVGWSPQPQPIPEPFTYGNPPSTGAITIISPYTGQNVPAAFPDILQYNPVYTSVGNPEYILVEWNQ